MSRLGVQTEAGFDAVEAKYGRAMVEQIRNWPIVTKNWMVAEGYPEMDPLVLKAVAEAERNTAHARRDKTYALEQADVIARNLAQELWGVVKTVAQLRREWEL